MKNTVLSLFTLFTVLAQVAAQRKYKRSESIRLWAASWNGDTNALKSLINSDADINWRNEDDVCIHLNLLSNDLLLL
jgi:hypothetical protein